MIRDDQYTIDEVAELLITNRSKVYEEIRWGRLKAEKEPKPYNGKHWCWLISEADLAEYEERYYGKKSIWRRGR